MPTQWYEKVFENFACQYDKECFTQGTVGEADFIEKELDFDCSKIILDIGCGTGRHAVELTKRGYSVTGIDMSENQLAHARQKANEAGVTVNFELRDARELDYAGSFDLVMMLCEGAFPLMETDEMNFKILGNAYRALKPGGKFIFTTLNLLFPLAHFGENFICGYDENKNYTDKVFDLATFRLHSVFSFHDDDGVEQSVHSNERYYAPGEIRWMLECLGFGEIVVSGCELGHFDRERPLSTDDMEILVTAVKPG
ncbi:MAG: class I SAM-dependent methyltransferase [Chloroflexi bacterium]|nr:class I SAM-dependent methyltransferase [Chloroflexota bacterium]